MTSSRARLNLRSTVLLRYASCLAFLLASVARAQAPGFDHEAFNVLLHEHVREGLVDYDAFEHSPRFEAYLARLAISDPATLPRADRLAFWINAYNAYTIALIVRHHERESIRRINKSFGFSLKGPWREPLARVGGRAYTLDAIENDIIRPEFREPRIHVALVCAALGCPPLRSEAYRGDILDAQLDDQARLFLLATPAKNRVDVAAHRVVLNPIFDWYKDDFGTSRAAVGAYVARFFPLGASRTLLESGQFDLEYSSYDWRLNLRTGAQTPR